MRVFGVTHSSWDGGGTYEPLHLTEDSAVSHLLEVVRKENEQYKKMYSDDDEFVDLEQMTLKDKGDNHWSNGMDDYFVKEFEVV